MKKIFKALSITVAAAALGAGVAVSAGCAGSNGVYNGEYHYYNEYGALYGIAVEVTVENNIITKIVDVTNTDNAYAKSVQVDKDGNAVEWDTVSPGWETYYKVNYGWLTGDYTGSYQEGDAIPDPSATAVYSYAWTDADAKVWKTYESWLLQQYVGWSVADILDISVYYSSYGEPYATSGGYNAELLSSGLLITNSTQGSGRLLLAVQDALSK